MYFDYPPFKNLSSPDIKTSTDRPVYAALNMYRCATLHTDSQFESHSQTHNYTHANHSHTRTHTHAYPLAYPLSLIRKRHFSLIRTPFQRGSGGNPQCGPITAVLSGPFISDRILAAPVDTGFFNGACRGDPGGVGSLGGVSLGVCDAWPPPFVLGNPPYLMHMLRPYLTFYNQSESLEGVGGAYLHWNLARLLIRLLSRNTYQIEVVKYYPLRICE